METIMFDIIDRILSNFDFTYMIVVNVLTYFIIKIIDSFNGDKSVSRTIKRIMLILSIIIMFIIYKLNNYDDMIVLINSSILAPVFWSWILKPIMIKLNISYKKDIK